MTSTPVLTDGVVTLRGFEPADAGWVFEACQDEAIQRWTLVPTPYTRGDAERFVGELAPGSWAEQGWGGLAVVDAVSNAGLASVGVVATGDDVAELGYWVAPWARRRGVGSAALAQLTTWVQRELGLARCELHVDEGNAASIATALRAGYRREQAELARLPRRGEGEGGLALMVCSP